MYAKNRLPSSGHNTPSPPSSPLRSPRLRHNRAEKSGSTGKFALGGVSNRSVAQRVAWIVLLVLLRRQGVFLLAPFLYISCMLFYMGTVSFDVVPDVIRAARRARGSVYRSPELYNKLRHDMDADNSTSDAMSTIWKHAKSTDWRPCINKVSGELFDGMITSVRLLTLHKQLPIFHYICRKVETLTGRKFSYKNLAQMKFIFPEGIQIDKILLHNKKTLCMEPHIKVTFLFDVIEGHTEPSDFLALSYTFSSRLLKFVSLHSEDCDVPEAELPEPFNRKEIIVSASFLPLGSSTKTLPNVDEAELLTPSHFSPFFRRYFLAKDVKDFSKTELSPC